LIAQSRNAGLLAEFGFFSAPAIAMIDGEDRSLTGNLIVGDIPKPSGFLAIIGGPVCAGQA
jgi:hypothetical protein